MTLLDILTKAAEIIGDADIVLTDADDSKTKKLISSANFIYRELTEEYVHLKYCENLTVRDGRLYYSEFTKPVKDVMKVKRNGREIGFKLYPLYLAADEDGEVSVSYVYHPYELSALNQEAELPPQYTPSAIAAGVASEYYYRSGLYDEGLYYKNRYDNTVLNLSRKRNPIKIKTRRFI